MPGYFDRIAVNRNENGFESFVDRQKLTVALTADAGEIEYCLLPPGLFEFDGFGPGLRRIAKSNVGATLAFDDKLHRLGTFAFDSVGHRHIKMFAVYLLLAEELVLVWQALGQPGLAQDDSGCAAFKTELVAV